MRKQLDATSFATGFGVCTILMIMNAGNWDFFLAALTTLVPAVRSTIIPGILVITGTLGFYRIACKLGFTKRKNRSFRMS